MQERNCPVCGSKKKHKIEEINLVNFDNTQGLFDHQIISGCEQCGAVFHEGIDLNRLDAYYNAYTAGAQVQMMTPDETILNNDMADFIQYHIRTPKEANILDVGCGFGWVISILKERGYTNVMGMDTDALLMEKLKKKGFKVERGNVYSQDKKEFDGRFQVIILKMVLEHLENPGCAVDNLKNWLVKRGILVIEVPDCSLYDKTAFFPGYFQSVNMEHINNYSAVSLMNLMKNWRMVACESTDSNGIFPVLRMAFQYDEGSERKPIFDKMDENRIIASLRIPSEKGMRLVEKIAHLKGKKCAVWGVSAFTRGLLTYTDLREMNVVCFVDKNPIFREKTLLGKPIIAPESLKDFDGTIVIPGKNSEKKILCNIKELGYRNKVVCLSN